MPESLPFETAVLATALTPTLRQFAVEQQPKLRARAFDVGRLNLALLHDLTLTSQLTDAPHVTAAPAQVERPVAGADGTVYFVPQARLAERSRATRAPHVFLAKSDGGVTLQVWFDLVRFPSLPSEAQPLPADGFMVSLLSAGGGRIDFTRCDSLPPAEGADQTIGRLYCETAVDPNTAVTMLQSEGTVFRVEADVHYATGQTAAPTPVFDPTDIKIAGPLRVSFGGMRGVGRPQRMASLVRSRALSDVRFDTAVLADIGAVVADPGPATTWTQQTSRMSLGAADRGGVAACFPPSVMQNRAIYAQVTSGFGSEPWSEWVESPNGRFMDSPVPDQFYVLPDEYRLAFDAETKTPSMMVLLVPPPRAEGAVEPTTFGGSYTLRTRFSVVPWIDPARRERLRAEIAQHAGIPYPQLLIGGARSASCRLSTVLHELGSSLVGSADTGVAVDPLGFDLVLDCTSEFYSTLSHLLVTDGVDAEVTVTLVSDSEQPLTAGVPVSLRLDRPASDVLSAELLPAAVSAPEVAPAVPEAAPDGVAAEAPPVAMPVGPPTLRVSNPLPYAVTVSQAAVTLLVVDETLPSPIGAVDAAAAPAAFTLPAAGEQPATIDLVLTPAAADQPPLYGAVGVAFLGVDIDIDPQQVLSKAYDTGSSGAVSSEVEVRCYQLEHPDVLPPDLSGVFGLEVQLRRSETAESITAFLTRDQPSMRVQVGFTLGDIMAGARPEQPTFQWRRRNMTGAGSGQWSPWESITGRQLFLSPTGM
ncbi:hypothetical protein [Microbacterium jejuense]|uniref:hypothetical protein n=1 Tax=Microbacterium jejuense TaxID=1263637 RepID=UPI0031EE8F09